MLFLTGHRLRHGRWLAGILVLSAAVAIASLPPVPQALAQTANSDPAPSSLPDSSPGSVEGAAAFSFGTAGDIGADSSSTATLNALAGAGTNFFLAIGDLSYHQIAPESAWCSYVKEHVGADYPFELLVGNHEEKATSHGGFIDTFAACLPDRLGVSGMYAHQYYFDYPPEAPLARFILIDPDLTRGANDAEYCKKGDTVNCAWLAARIDEAKRQGLWTIVGMHKNCITMGEKSCEIGASLFNVLVERKVDVILQGHDHGYQRSKQLGLGTTCASIVPDAYNEGCVVDDGADGVYERGAGPVLLIPAKSGREAYAINPADAEAPYFATWMYPNNDSFGFTKFTVSESSIEAQFIAGTGTYADHFTIAQTGPEVRPESGPETGAFAPVTTPAPAPINGVQTLTFTTVADTYVSADEPTSNFGMETRIRLDASPATVGYLRFNVQGLTQPVTSAMLNVYATSKSKDGYAAAVVADDTWLETELTYGSAPAAGAPAGSSGAFNSKTWTQIDVTALVTGNGTLNLALLGTSETATVLSSREGTNPPVLVVTTGAE